MDWGCGICTGKLLASIGPMRAASSLAAQARLVASTTAATPPPTTAPERSSTPSTCTATGRRWIAVLQQWCTCAACNARARGVRSVRCPPAPGCRFYVVGMGSGTWNESAVATYNLANPILRDTLTLLVRGRQASQSRPASPGQRFRQGHPGCTPHHTTARRLPCVRCGAGRPLPDCQPHVRLDSHPL
jgi:hypothetical protein